MRTTADLNRIIDKIADTNPARFDATSSERVEVSQSPVPRSSETSSGDKSPKADGGNDEKTDSRPLDPRFAEEFDSLAPSTTRSARTRRRTSDDSTSRLASLRSSDENAKSGKVGKTVKVSEGDAEKRASKDADEEIKRTQRRRQIDPTTCERDYSTDEIEFMKALDDYKRSSGRMFPTCSEILEVFKSLGYVKIARDESPDDSPKRNARTSRAATPAFLNDEENDAFKFDDAPVLGIA